MEALVVDNVTIPAQYLKVDAVRSGGPGGQNVNKLSTKVLLTFELDTCPVLSEQVKVRLRELIGRHTNKEGQPVITCQVTRHQERNLEIARQKLADLIRKALVVPVERKETRPTKGSQEKRLEEKRRRGDRKRFRRDVNFE